MPTVVTACLEVAVTNHCEGTGKEHISSGSESQIPSKKPGRYLAGMVILCDGTPLLLGLGPETKKTMLV